jgi:putative DNA primase/helicase
VSADAALDIAGRGWPVFPCQWQGEGRKRPLTEHGLKDATTDILIITAWWTRWPEALIGIPTGSAIGAVVLDIDVKDDRANGYDTLDDLGCAILPDTPMVHTASGGLHLYFAIPARGLRNTGGSRGRGIGPGLDWRGDGGYVIVPPSNGYIWDPHWNFDTVPLAEVPAALLPREPERPPSPEPVKPTTGLSPYAEAALDSACRNIIAAPAGEQEATINGECFAIGTLAGANGIPAAFARRTLIWAAARIPSYDNRRPWHSTELERKVERAFADGLRHPREALRV